MFGATGYTGIELVGLLDAHPHTELTFATSETYAGKSLSDVAAGSPDIPLQASAEASVSDADVVFLCLPHAAAAPTARSALEAGCRVIDLSADFRLRDAAEYTAWYEVDHPCPERLATAVYGLTEDARGPLAEARLVANPGCYATSVLLALKPVLQADLPITGPVVADAKSGVSGAGRAPKLGSLFAEVSENFLAYKVGRKHRHVPEMDQQMATWRSPAPPLLFSPHLLPIKRGILSTIYVPLGQPRHLDDLHARYCEAYDHETFVDVLPRGKLPSIAHVARNNRCCIGLQVEGSMLIVVSAIDNLLKGAAGQAVQNFNAMHGWPEATGLPR